MKSEINSVEKNPELHEEDSENEDNLCPACGEEGFYGYCNNCGYPN